MQRAARWASRAEPSALKASGTESKTQRSKRLRSSSVEKGLSVVSPPTHEDANIVAGKFIVLDSWIFRFFRIECINSLRFRMTNR